MAKEFKKASQRAKNHSDAARQSSKRHSDDLKKMRQVSCNATDSLKTARDRQRKREDFSQAAARIVREATKD